MRAALALILLASCTWMNGDVEGRHAVLVPGQDELIARMLGKDELVDACRFSGGVADGATIRAFYKCAAVDLEVEVVHRDAATWRMTRTEHLGIRVLNGSAPDGFMTALSARLRRHEAELRWNQIGQSHQGRRLVGILIVLAALTFVVSAALVRPSLSNSLAPTGSVLAGTLAAILLLEGVLRITGLERLLISPALYLQHNDVPVHRVSADPFLHYEMAPDTEMLFRSRDGRDYRVTIDSFGARGTGHSGAKGTSTFRILCFGGSTMYGASVNDDETIPARLQAHLNKQSFERAGVVNFDVWNFGTSAYTLGQAAHLAHRRLMDLDPDLIIVQHHNLGRRPFLATGDPSPEGELPASQELNADFYLEQFIMPEWVPASFNVSLLACSKLYRVCTAMMTLLRQRGSWPCRRCDEISAGKARTLSLAAERLGVPVLFVAIPADGGRYSAPSIFPELSPDRFIDLFESDREAAYYDVHPPPHILDEWAAELARALRSRGLLAPSS